MKLYNNITKTQKNTKLHSSYILFYIPIFTLYIYTCIQYTTKFSVLIFESQYVLIIFDKKENKLQVDILEENETLRYVIYIYTLFESGDGEKTPWNEIIFKSKITHERIVLSCVCVLAFRKKCDFEFSIWKKLRKKVNNKKTHTTSCYNNINKNGHIPFRLYEKKFAFTLGLCFLLARIHSSNVYCSKYKLVLSMFLILLLLKKRVGNHSWAIRKYECLYCVILLLLV